MKRNPLPRVRELRAQWQIDQGKACGCGGSDDLCACQNEEAPWRYGLGPKPPPSVIAWLLEWPASDNQPVRWWNPDTGWMVDANKACWFARQCDAESYKRTSRMHGCIVSTEHVFGLSTPEGCATKPDGVGEASKPKARATEPRPSSFTRRA